MSKKEDLIEGLKLAQVRIEDYIQKLEKGDLQAEDFKYSYESEVAYFDPHAQKRWGPVVTTMIFENHMSLEKKEPDSLVNIYQTDENDNLTKLGECDGLISGGLDIVLFDRSLMKNYIANPKDLEPIFDRLLMDLGYTFVHKNLKGKSYLYIMDRQNVSYDRLVELLKDPKKLFTSLSRERLAFCLNRLMASEIENF